MKQAITLLLLFVTTLLHAQIDVGGRVKNKVNQRVQQKTDEAIDKTLDKTEEGVKEAAKGDKKKKKEGESETESGTDADKPDNGNEEKGNGNDSNSSPSAKPTLKTYSKYDFVPGEKILVIDNFAQVSVGDFPLDWNTNSGGEVVTIEGMEGKWLSIDKEGVFMPDYITELPDNFTLEFDVVVNEDFNFFSGMLECTFIPTDQRAHLNDFGRYSSPNSGVRFATHPQDAGSYAARAIFLNWDNGGSNLLRNEITTKQFFAPESNLVHVSMWRQKQRLRVYMNEEKVFDIPRAFDAAVKYNAFTLCIAGDKAQEQDKYLFSNFRLAVGAPDTRSKLITEGKFVTHGILFDSGSDKIKPESFGALKDIATVLNENPTVKVKIIGHTDSDGDDNSNLELSKKRAAAVRESLSKDFGIDVSRMETDGKGESLPADKNDTPVGKANNRRVEFVKI